MFLFFLFSLRIQAFENRIYVKIPEKARFFGLEAFFYKKVVCKHQRSKSEVQRYDYKENHTAERCSQNFFRL